MAARIELVLTESDVSIVNNTSKVTAKLYYYGNGVSYSGYQKKWTITIDGTTYSGTNTFTTSTSAQLLGTASKVVTHNDNGAKTVAVSASFETKVSIGTLTTSKSLPLTTIPRVSDLSINKTSVPADGSTTVIATATKKASSFTDELTVSLGSYSQTIESGVAFTIPEEWINAIAGTSAVATVKVTTKSGSTTIGSKTVSLTVTVPASVVPVINEATITEAVAAVTTAFGSRFVQNLSQLNVSIDAEGVYGSTIKSYSTTLDGVNYIQQAFTSNVLKTAGSLTLAVTVTDSRGRTASTTVTVTVIEYNYPAITGMAYIHCDADGTQNSNGTSTKVTISGKVYPVENQNGKTLKLKYKATSDETYTERAVTVSDWTFSVDVLISGTDPSVTYEYIAELTDKINTANPATYRVTTGIVVISRLAGGKGVTLFAEAEHEGFWVKDVDYTITSEEYTSLTALLAEIVVGGVRLIDWIYPVGHIITSSNPEFNPNLIYRTTTWERYAAGRTLVGVDATDDDFNSVGKTGGEATHTLVTNEIPAHYHNMREYGNTFNMYTSSKSTSTSGDIFVRKLTAANGFVSSVSDTDTYRLRTEDVGGGKAHNNMPPYITVYFWRRTA